MKARKLIEGATYGPETLKVIGKALDDAWSEISGHFSTNGLQSQSARLKLAHAVLAVARDDSREVAVPSLDQPFELPESKRVLLT